MLKVGGENVAASEIERVIAEVPGIVGVAVVAARDTKLDEAPVAFVVAETSHDDLPGRVIAACRPATTVLGT
jgi:crotonobetaine/carnitine-CoA ligase